MFTGEPPPARRRCPSMLRTGPTGFSLPSLSGTHRRKCPNPRLSPIIHVHPRPPSGEAAAQQSLHIAHFQSLCWARDRALFKQEVTGSIPVGSIPETPASDWFPVRLIAFSDPRLERLLKFSPSSPADSRAL